MKSSQRHQDAVPAVLLSMECFNMGRVMSSLVHYMKASEVTSFILQFSTLLHTGLLHDMLCLYNSQKQQFHTLVTLGANVCGHPRITHGGKRRLR